MNLVFGIFQKELPLILGFLAGIEVFSRIILPVSKISLIDK